MITPPTPHDERKRLEVLRALNILDTPPEERFDRVTRLARCVFDVPIALVSLVDANRQWFKSRQGLAACETSREISFCGHAILGDAVFVIEDAAEDERFSDNPLVTGNPGIRFYAGYPLSAPDGSKLGTLCIIDDQPRNFSSSHRHLLSELGRMIEEEMIALDLRTTDGLTGLSNRRGFDSIAQHALAMCRRLDQPASLLYLDIEEFGKINAQFGTDIGDRTLVEVAHVMLATFRDSDVVGRVGGDEFAVILVGPDQSALGEATARLRHKLTRHNVTSERSYTLSLAGAVVRYDPARHACVDALLQEAEQRLSERRAKTGEKPPAKPAASG